MKRRTLRTRRLEIRPLRPSDYATWLEAQSFPSLSRFDRGPLKVQDCTRASFKKVIQKHQAREKADQLYVWGVFERKSGTLIGMFDVAILHRRSIQKGNIGYRVFNWYWRQGFGREFVEAAIPHALRDLKLNRLEAVIDPENRASVALVRSVGMKREGIRRKYYFQDGEWADQVVYTACRADWGIPALRL